MHGTVIDSGKKYPKEKDSAQEILNKIVCKDEYSFNTPKYKKCADDKDVDECNKIVKYCSQSKDIAKEVYSAKVVINKPVNKPVCKDYGKCVSEFKKCINDQD